MPRYVIHIVILTSFLVLIKCATRGRPSGGPVDETPPEIVNTFPTIDSLGIKNLEKIVIYFSERMDEPSVQNALFISPPLKYEPDWSGGDELILELVSDSLQPNQTYVITIGAEAKDSRRNGLKESFQFAFSTGDHLDQGKISGTVYGLKRKDVMYLFAYKIAQNDTIDPRFKRARFFTQTGKQGVFRLSYLPVGDYRVYVVQDQNRNLLLDAAYEQIGIPAQDVKIDSGSLSFENLNFMLSKIDTTTPFISGARAINEHTVLLRISEQITFLDTGNISITDTLGRNNLEIKGITKLLSSGNQYHLYTAEQDSATSYLITVSGIMDSSGNKQKEPSVINFAASTIRDTTQFRLENVSPPDSAGNFSIFSGIKINFSMPINTKSVSSNFAFIKNEDDTLTGFWKWEELKNGYFKLENDLDPGNEYHFSINMAGIRSVWGDSLPDSLITHVFTTLSADEFGSLSGKILIKSKNEYPLYLSAQSLKRKTQEYTIKISGTDEFRYDWLPEGQYLLNGYLDLDNNGKWSAGQFNPFKYSEPFYFQNDTIRIRKRWEVSDKIFQIPGW